LDDRKESLPQSLLQYFYNNATVDCYWLYLLSTVSPTMQSVHISIDLRDYENFVALRAALITWSLTLHHLSVTHSYSPFIDHDEAESDHDEVAFYHDEAESGASSARSLTFEPLDDKTIRQLVVLEQLRTDTVVVPPTSLRFFPALRHLDYTLVGVEQHDTSLLDVLRQIPTLVRLRVTADALWEGKSVLDSLCAKLNIEVELIRRPPAMNSADDEDPLFEWTDSDSLGGSDEYDWEDHYRRAND
jgi:hypothetical protein